MVRSHKPSMLVIQVRFTSAPLCLAWGLSLLVRSKPLPCGCLHHPRTCMERWAQPHALLVSVVTAWSQDVHRPTLRIRFRESIQRPNRSTRRCCNTLQAQHSVAPSSWFPPFPLALVQGTDPENCDERLIRRWGSEGFVPLSSARNIFRRRKRGSAHEAGCQPSRHLRCPAVSAKSAMARQCGQGR